MKPLGKTVFALAQLLVETVNVVANMVAERCPARYKQWQPIIKPAVAFVLIGTVAWMVLKFLLSLVDR